MLQRGESIDTAAIWKGLAVLGALLVGGAVVVVLLAALLLGAFLNVVRWML